MRNQIRKALWKRTSFVSVQPILPPGWKMGLALGLLLMATSQTFSQESRDPLLDLMIEKGMVTSDEAHKVRIEAEARRTNNAAMQSMDSKWKFSKAVKSLEIYGDLRLRYENREASAPDSSRVELNRLRYSLRLGLRGELFDDYYYGLRLDTAPNPRSPWVTLGNSASGVPYQGPFGKSTSGINVGQLFMGARPADWFDITLGKMPNPLYTTPMVWDSDYSPEGAAERFKYTVGQADFFATFGQFVYQDVNPTDTSPGLFNLGFNQASPAFLFAWQAGATYHFNKRLSLKVAPVLYTYSGQGANLNAPGNTLVPDFSGTFVGQGSTNNLAGKTQGWSGYPGGYYDGFAANQTGIRNLTVLEIPAELNLKLDKYNLRLFGDYAYNLDGADRAREAYRASRSAFQPLGYAITPIKAPQTGDTKAYQIGLAFGNSNSLGLVYGQTSRKHAWEIRTYWQHVEQYALDPNLLDSDFFEGRGNLEGVFAAFAYGLTDNVIATLRYGNASRINNNLGTGGSNQDIPQVNPIQNYSLFQVDLTVRF